MKNSGKLSMSLQELKIDNIKRQKRGVHFILASIFIWIIITCIHASSLSIMQKNLITFFCSTLLIPLAFLLSKILKIDFRNKENPLSRLGFLISLNQMLYILIAMWIYSALPEKMLMVYAIIFGAHLLPYGWLYQSKVYYIFSILIPITVLSLGIFTPAFFIAVFMLIIEVIFCILLIIENKQLND